MEGYPGTRRSGGMAEDEDADGLIDFPDPQSLLAKVDDQDSLKEEGPDNADYDDGLLLDDDAGDDLFLDSEDGFSISGEDDDIDGVAAGLGVALWTALEQNRDAYLEYVNTSPGRSQRVWHLLD